MDDKAKRYQKLQQDSGKARARLSLRPDVYDQHRSLVEAILRSEHEEASAAARMETRLSHNDPRIERYRKVITDLKAQPQLDLTMLSVGLKESQGVGCG